MNLLAVLLALSPVIVILLLLTLRRTAADVAGLIGWAFTLLVACLYFHTPLCHRPQGQPGRHRRLAAHRAGGGHLHPAGDDHDRDRRAIARIVALIKTVAPGNQVVQIMLINVGFGTLLTALGAVPVSILPPIMLALGYSSFAAIALPAIGYDALCTYALLGVPVVVFAGFVGKPVGEVGGLFRPLHAGHQHLHCPRHALDRRPLEAGVAGAGAGPARRADGGLHRHRHERPGARHDHRHRRRAGRGRWSCCSILKVTGQPLARPERSQPRVTGRRSSGLSLGAALSPWILLTVFALLVNAPFLPFFDLAFTTLGDAGGDHPRRAGEGAALLAGLLLDPGEHPAGAALPQADARPAPAPRGASGSSGPRGRCWPPPSFSPSPTSSTTRARGSTGHCVDPAHNMVARAGRGQRRGLRARSTRLVAPFLGLLGGFISGSETSSIAMLTALHLETADKIGGQRAADRRGQRHRRRAGQRHLAGQAPERRGQHRPHRRGIAGDPHHLCRLSCHHGGLRRDGAHLGVLKEGGSETAPPQHRMEGNR